MLDRRPIAANNYSIGRTDVQGTAAIDMIILHHMYGTMESAEARFKHPSQEVSAHIGIALEDDRLWQWVDDYDTAYHAGVWSVNKRSIGIECEDKSRDVGESKYNGTSPFTDEFYARLARLVADKCKHHHIIVDRHHIKEHGEIVPTQCPGSLDVDRVVALVRTLLVPTPIGVKMLPMRIGQSADLMLKPNEVGWLQAIYAYENHPQGRTITKKVVAGSAVGRRIITVYPPVDVDADETMQIDAEPTFFVVDVLP